MINVKPLARFCANFGISFLTTFLAFDFIIRVPTEQVIVGSLLSSSVVAGLSILYELRKWGESKK